MDFITTMLVFSMVHCFAGIGYVLFTAKCVFPVVVSISAGCMCLPVMVAIDNTKHNKLLCSVIVGSTLTMMMVMGYFVRRISWCSDQFVVDPLVYMAFIDGLIIPGNLVNFYVLLK